MNHTAAPFIFPTCPNSTPRCNHIIFNAFLMACSTVRLGSEANSFFSVF